MHKLDLARGYNNKATYAEYFFVIFSLLYLQPGISKTYENY